MVVCGVPLWPLVQFFHRATRKALWPEIKPLLRDRLYPAKMAGTKQESPSAPALFQMATGYWMSQAIYVAAKLGIADLLKDGPQSCVPLATATASNASSLFRLLRALASVGVFSQVSKDASLFLALLQSLLTDAPGSFRAMVIMLGEIHYQACGNLLHSVQTGAPAFNKKFGMSLFDYLHHNADAADSFNQGMTNLSSMLAYAILMAYDFTGLSSIVDIGGGEGKLLRTIVKANPEMRWIVFDTPPPIVRAKQRRGNDVWSRRCSYVAGNFFESVPKGADAYLLCGVVSRLER